MKQAIGPRTVNALGSKGPETPGSRGLPVLDLDKRTYARALDCVHCGLCLPACPTYTENGLEADSPRGRIVLMKALADGRIDSSPSVLEHLDLCLDCRACETACPSGVVYHELIEETRARLGESRPQTFVDRVVDLVFYQLFPHPMRLKLSLLPVRLVQKLGLWGAIRRLGSAVLPASFDKMQQMLPSTGPWWEKPLAAAYERTDGSAAPRATVGMFPGCVGSVLFQHVNRQTVALLQKAGCDVLVPPRQRCCGAIHHHGGHVQEAQAYARSNIDAFSNPDGTPRADFIVNNIAGCGAMLKDYAHLLRDDADYAARAGSFVQRVRDISELLVELGCDRPPHPVDRTVTYHDACHLAHAQKVTDPPRHLLSHVKGLHVVPLAESDMCCGAAGTYNLAQPQMARQLAERKIRHIQGTGARVCVTGNVGCAMQIQSEAQRLGVDLQVTHPVSLLYEAHFGAEATEAIECR